MKLRKTCSKVRNRSFSTKPKTACTRRRPFLRGASALDGGFRRCRLMRHHGPPSIPADDVVVAFRTQNSNIRGRLVRLGATLDEIVAPHAMPDLPGPGAIGSAGACRALRIGSAARGKSQSHDALGRGRFDSRCRLCGEAASFEDMRATMRRSCKTSCRSAARPNAATALGNGHLAITLDSGPGEERYQGVLAFENAPLSAHGCRLFPATRKHADVHSVRPSPSITSVRGGNRSRRRAGTGVPGA